MIKSKEQIELEKELGFKKEDHEAISDLEEQEDAEVKKVLEDYY